MIVGDLDNGLKLLTIVGPLFMLQSVWRIDLKFLSDIDSYL